MKKTLAIIVAISTLGFGSHAQQQGGTGFFSFGSGTGVPTDTAMGGLLGMLIAPMISKGSDAKLVGALLGGMGANALSTARYNSQQQQMYYQQPQAYQPYQPQPRRVNYANFPQGGAYPQQSEYVPEGMIARNGFIQSPFSAFSVDPKSNGIYRGQVIFDPFTGAPFRVP